MLAFGRGERDGVLYLAVRRQSRECAVVGKNGVRVGIGKALRAVVFAFEQRLYNGGAVERLVAGKANAGGYLLGAQKAPVALGGRERGGYHFASAAKPFAPAGETEAFALHYFAKARVNCIEFLFHIPLRCNFACIRIRGQAHDKLYQGKFVRFRYAVSLVSRQAHANLPLPYAKGM